MTPHFLHYLEDAAGITPERVLVSQRVYLWPTPTQNQGLNLAFPFPTYLISITEQTPTAIFRSSRPLRNPWSGCLSCYSVRKKEHKTFSDWLIGMVYAQLVLELVSCQR
jgi:hypothetical protein